LLFSREGAQAAYKTRGIGARSSPRAREPADHESGQAWCSTTENAPPCFEPRRFDSGPRAQEPTSSGARESGEALGGLGGKKEERET
jgi:hypothetical protein